MYISNVRTLSTVWIALIDRSLIISFASASWLSKLYWIHTLKYCRTLAHFIFCHLLIDLNPDVLFSRGLLKKLDQWNFIYFITQVANIVYIEQGKFHLLRYRYIVCNLLKALRVSIAKVVSILPISSRFVSIKHSHRSIYFHVMMRLVNCVCKNGSCLLRVLRTIHNC